MFKNKYKAMIERYIREAQKDLKDAETEEERNLSLYLLNELNSIINDVESGISPNSGEEEDLK